MWQPYAVMAGVLVVVAGLGMRATEIGPWYRALKKPAWQPPDWVFGPVWTTIYVLITWSVGRIWPQLAADERTTLIVLLSINLVLNIAWSYLFFTARRPAWSLIEVVPLWLSIAALIVFMAGTDALSAWLLVPYAVWVAVAAWLNRTIVRLNPNAHTLDADTAEPS